MSTFITQPVHEEQTVILASLSIAGVYYPNQFVGPAYADATSASISSTGSGAGFYRVTQPGTLSKFQWTNSSTPGSPIPADIWLAPGANPSLFAYTGVSLSMPAGEYITENNVDVLDVLPDDIIVVLNPDLGVGYTPGQMTITAQFIPN